MENEEETRVASQRLTEATERDRRQIERRWEEEDGNEMGRGAGGHWVHFHYQNFRAI